MFPKAAKRRKKGVTKALPTAVVNKATRAHHVVGEAHRPIAVGATETVEILAISPGDAQSAVAIAKHTTN